jgi:hypothetical protein
MKTQTQIKYSMEWAGSAIIPMGTRLIKADNLPYKNAYWAENWDDMSESEKSWSRNYGFLIFVD